MITRITFSRAPVRKVPKAGDERFLKGRGVTQIRQQQRCWTHGAYGAWVVSNGRPVWEWVDKGGPRDRSAANWKPNQ
jgi:hypothetical protein